MSRSIVFVHGFRRYTVSFNLKIILNPFMPELEFAFLSFGRICFEFKGCWVIIYNFVQILKVLFVSKKCM